MLDLFLPLEKLLERLGSDDVKPICVEQRTETDERVERQYDVTRNWIEDTGVRRPKHVCETKIIHHDAHEEKCHGEKRDVHDFQPLFRVFDGCHALEPDELRHRDNLFALQRIRHRFQRPTNRE